MLHSLLGNMVSWYFTAAPTLARTHRVLLYDLRGHGKTERAPSGYDLRTMAADLSALLNGFDCGRVSIVGHSFGGLVGLRYALDHPERVSRLALVDIPMPPTNMEEIDAIARRSPEELLNVLPSRMRDSIVIGGDLGRQAQRTLQSLQFLFMESSLMQDIMAEPNFSEEILGRLTCPVRCIYGDQSSCLAAGRRLSQVLPNGELIVLSGGHYLPTESSVALTACLEEFLNG
jgi:pimeloyl-ACP methyl ester carboxylesterase